MSKVQENLGNDSIWYEVIKTTSGVDQSHLMLTIEFHVFQHTDVQVRHLYVQVTTVISKYGGDSDQATP